MGGLAAAALIRLFPILIVGVICLIVQIGVTSRFLKNGRPWVALGIWLVYPAFVGGYSAYDAYTDYRIERTIQKEFSSRTIPPTANSPRNILIDGIGLSGQDKCDESCLFILHAGILDSIAMRSPTPSNRLKPHKFKVYRLAHGESCAVAKRNEITLVELQKSLDVTHREWWQLSMKSTSLDGKRGAEHHKKVLEDLRKVMASHGSEILEYSGKPRTGIFTKDSKGQLGFTSTFGGARLTARGHFDQCITVTYQYEYKFDVKIIHGGEVRRPNGPCCNIAEIYERIGDRHRLLARWEAGNHDFNRQPFETEHIIAALTGNIIRYDVEPRSAGSVLNELAQLVTLTEKGTYLADWRYICDWLEQVFQQEADRKGISRIDLNDHDIVDLIQLLQTHDQQHTTALTTRFQRILSQESLDRLRAAETKYLTPTAPAE